MWTEKTRPRSAGRALALSQLSVVEPAFGRNEEPGAAESHKCPQNQQGQRSHDEGHRGGCGDDQPGKGSIGADVPDPLDDPSAVQRGQCEAAGSNC